VADPPAWEPRKRSWIFGASHSWCAFWKRSKLWISKHASWCWVENPDVDGGQIASLRCALTALEPIRPPAVLVWPVDLPHVHVSTIERLIEAYRRGRQPVTVPSFAGLRGHPVIWDQRVFEELRTSAEATRDGARAVLHAHAEDLQQVPVDDPAVTDVINTPADYERLIRDINRDVY